MSHQLSNPSSASRSGSSTRRGPLARTGLALAVAVAALVSIVLGAGDASVGAETVPVNDSFSNPTVLSTGATGSISGTTVGATGEPGEYFVWEGDVGCPIDVESVWYSWTPASTDYVYFWTEMPSLDDDSTLAVFTGSSLDTVELVIDNDQYRLANASLVVFEAIAGTTYRIRVAAACGEQWPFTLNWEPDTYAPGFQGNPVATLVNQWTARLTFIVVDDLPVTTSCQVNTAAFTPCSSGWRVELPRGTHTLRVKAVDAAGNHRTLAAEVIVKAGRIRPT